MKKIFSLGFSLIICFTSLGGMAAASEVYDRVYDGVDDSVNASAKAFILYAPETDEVIFAKNEFGRLPMASTTKIMSTLIALEQGSQNGGLDAEFVVDDESVKIEGSSMGLHEGDIVTIRDLCYGMLLPSGNDAANAVAVKISGNITDFADVMNERAATIGMIDTNFANPSGLHAYNHYSTAYDLALLTDEALKNEIFREICGTKTVKLSIDNSYNQDSGDVNVNTNRWLTNSNKLLTLYDDCIGVKTGFTDEAGRCLVSAAVRDGVMLICVTLNASNDWGDHIRLYEKGFAALNKKPIRVSPDDLYVDIVGGELDRVPLKLARQPYYAQAGDTAVELTANLYAPAFVYAPVNQGDTVGTMKFYVNGNLADEVPLTVAQTCEAVVAPKNKSLYRIIVDFIKNLMRNL